MGAWPVALTLLAAAVAAGRPAESGAALDDARTPADLEEAAVRLCRTGGPDALRALGRRLAEPAFRRRLDDDADYRSYQAFYSTPLRIHRVLTAVARAGPPAAEEVLLGLAADRAFTAHRGRLTGLIHAAGWVRRPSPRLLDFLDEPRLWQAASLLTVEALVRLGTPRAFAVIEEHVFSDDYPEYEKSMWFASVLLSHRYEAPVVGLCHRTLLRGIKEPKTRNTAFQILFDYHLKVWQATHDPCYGDEWHPPRARDAPEAVLREVLEIGALAERLDVPRGTREGVRRACTALEDLLRRRRLDHSPARLARLIAGLDDDDFPAREQAQRELGELGDLAEDALRQALAGRPSFEVQRRIRELLERLPQRRP
jgi:hypothetical protein